MSVITEAALRILLKDEDLSAMKEYRVEAGTIVTPSARAYLIDNKIDLVIGNKRVIRNPSSPEEKPVRRYTLPAGDEAAEAPPAPPPESAEKSALPAFQKPDRYASMYGGSYAEKPEYMTALHGNLLVFKDHKQIALRGRLDSLEARIIETQLAFKKAGAEKDKADLGEVLSYVQKILRAEVRSEPLAPMELWGMDEGEIRSRSHTPKKYYGIPHFFPSADDGEVVVRLNCLRAEAREVELVAYQAFKKEDGTVERGDIVQAFNRLSSVFYVMMYRAKTGKYE